MKIINAFSSYSVKTKRDGQTDRQTDRRMGGGGGVVISSIPGLRRGRWLVSFVPIIFM